MHTSSDFFLVGCGVLCLALMARHLLGVEFAYTILAAAGDALIVVGLWHMLVTDN